MIIIDLNKTDGKIKPMNAVNNGPAGSVVRGMSNFEYYAAAEIPYARNHDASFYSGYGGEHTVDVHRIFRDFDADENDPASYVFGPTDKYLASIDSVGTKTFYRLGASIEHEYKYGTYPPKDFEKWARICEHIIRHYNEGWADGFHYDIKYWEIWNEPELKNPDGTSPCWQGTFDEFLKLYEISAKHLKKCFPHIKIGGPAFTVPWRNEFTEGFLKYVSEKNIPLDFYSYHTYLKQPCEVTDGADISKAMLAENGLDSTEIILNEWNYLKGWIGDEFKYTLKSQKGIKGASFIAGVMCVGQASDIDMLMYYDARPSGFCGMFDTTTLEPLKGYYPFFMFKDLKKLGTYVKTDYEGDGIYSCAATNGKESAVMLTYFLDDDAAEAKEVKVSFKNVKSDKGVRVSYYLLDENHNSELVREEIFTAETFSAILKFDIYTSYLVKITAL